MKTDMRIRFLWIGSAAIMALLISYYAGYQKGLRAGRPWVEPVAAAAPTAAPTGESERLREPAPPLKPASIPKQNSRDYDVLLARDLTAPLAGLKRSQIIDTFDQARSGGRRHEATDIMADRGTPIHAVQDGTIKKLFLSKAGGITIYEFDIPEIYCLYYAHLDRYAPGLREGMSVKKGDVIGYVGSTGDASPAAPHLHFAIVKLGPDKKWWEGTSINPYPILLQLADR